MEWWSGGVVVEMEMEMERAGGGGGEKCFFGAPHLASPRGWDWVRGKNWGRTS